MLKDEPELNQAFLFGAWSGTPGALARTAAGLRSRVHPTGEFEAIVESTDGRKRTANEVEALNALEAREPIRRVILRLSSERHGWPRVHVELGDSNAIHVDADTENEARAMLATAQAVVMPNVPWWGRLMRQRAVRFYHPGIVTALLFQVSAMVAGAIAAGYVGLAVGSLIGVLLSWVGSKFGQWLLPPFELHEGQSRWQRFRWGLFVFVAFELGGGAILRAI